MGSLGGAGPAARLWARSELRARWRTLVTLGVLAGIAAGLGLAAMAGARRTATAYSRWRTVTVAPDAIVFGTQVGKNDVDYRPVLKLPEVAGGGLFELAQVGLKGYQLGSLPAGDDQLYRTVSRPLLRHGRLPDPGRQDEVLVNRLAAKRYHFHIGQQVTLTSALDRQAFYGLAPDDTGPEVRARIVGIGDSMMNIVFGTNEPWVMPSGAYLTQHPQIGRAPNLVVRLNPGTDVAAFHRRADAALRLPDIPVRDLAQDRKRITHGTDLERTGLWLFAAAVILASIVLIGQALARTVYAMAESASPLRTLGFTRADLVQGLVLPTGVTAFISGGLAMASAFLFSTRFPVGLGRQLDPSLSLHADWVVIGPGAAAVVALVLAGAAVAGYRAAVASDKPPVVTTPSSMLRWIRNALPLPAALGTGLALQSGQGKRAVPVRPALAGAVAGLLGIVGALGLVRGIDDALHTPSRSGQVWDAAISPDERHPMPTLVDRLDHDGRVATVTDVILVPLDVEGAGLPVYALKPEKSFIRFVVLNGREPVGPDEVALGPATVKALHKHIGDSVRIGGSFGTRTMNVVGVALLPQTPHASFDQGVWISTDGLPTLVDPNNPTVEPAIAVTGRRGITSANLVAHLSSSLGGAEVDPVTQPQDVLLLRNVRDLPRVLALFLLLLGVAAIGHALVTTVRRRRHDLAVLRALGLRPRQSAACILWQGTTVALIGLVLGLPLGIVVGRLSWRWVANSTPLLYVGPVPLVEVLLAVPITVAVANLLAVWPARQAAALRPGEVLRSE